MKTNIGSADRIIRIVLTAVLGYLYFSGTVTGITGLVLVITGGILLATSLVSFCPIYAIFGLSSCSVKKQL